MFEGPEFQPADAANLLHVGRIVPVYRLTSGLTATRLRGAMREALDRAGSAYPEYLPPAIRSAEGVPPIAEALESAHYPTTSRRATRRSAGSPSTSCSRSSWAWSRGGGRADGLARSRSPSALPTTPGSGRRSPRRCRASSAPRST